MEYNSCFLKLCIWISSITFTSGWQFFTALSDIDLVNSQPIPHHTHSEYVYGDCKRKDIKFYTRVQLDSLQVLGKVIVRGWIDVMRIPTCVRLRAISYHEDMFRSTAYPFQMCVPRISYCHSRMRYKYYYFEWYIPLDMIGGMLWEISFFGPKTLDWGV